jgi:hypothetical protein
MVMDNVQIVIFSPFPHRRGLVNVEQPGLIMKMELGRSISGDSGNAPTNQWLSNWFTRTGLAFIKLEVFFALAMMLRSYSPQPGN